MYGAYPLAITMLTASDCQSTLINAMVKGSAVLIEDLEGELDPFLYPFLALGNTKKNGNFKHLNAFLLHEERLTNVSLCCFLFLCPKIILIIGLIIFSFVRRYQHEEEWRN